MRKLLSVPVLSCLLMAIPPAPASPDDGDLEAVPSLVAVSTFARDERDRSDNAPSLISSPVASDPLDHQEAGNRLRAAAHAARRSLVRQRAAAGSSEPAPSAANLTGAPVPPQLEAIAACESGGDPRATGGGGAYRGKYQFSPATWRALGGSGDPAAASEAEQDRRAATLYARSGAAQWPACGG